MPISMSWRGAARLQLAVALYRPPRLHYTHIEASEEKGNSRVLSCHEEPVPPSMAAWLHRGNKHSKEMP